MRDDPARLPRPVRGEVERRLRELHAAGELSSLPGEGGPFAPDPDDGAGDAWAARHVLRTSGSLPVWAELRREIADERARLVARVRRHLNWLRDREALLDRLSAERIVGEREATRTIDERVRGELGRAVEALNALASRHDLMVPPSLQLSRLSVERLSELARARAEGPGTTS